MSGCVVRLRPVGGCARRGAWVVVAWVVGAAGALPAGAAAIVYRTVALSSTAAPGTPAGAQFGSFGAPVMDAAGRAAFEGTLRTGVGGVTSADSKGIWSEGGGSLALVARAGGQAPGTPDGAKFASFGVPAMSAGGRTVFNATLRTTGGGVTTSNNSGIWSEGAGR
jgi:hypothetical protein